MILSLTRPFLSQVMDKIKFFDDNTQLWWSPATGGGNVPALNQLLKPFGAALSDTVWKGDFKVSEGVLGSPLQTLIKSGTSIARWPAQGVIWKNQMQDEVT
jgi:membrane-bound transcription factor site-1 protease